MTLYCRCKPADCESLQHKLYNKCIYNQITVYVGLTKLVSLLDWSDCFVSDLFYYKCIYNSHNMTWRHLL